MHPDDCAFYEDYAAKVQEARQRGISMTKVMEVAGEFKATRLIVVAAYERPMWNTEKMQEREIKEFLDSGIASICYSKDLSKPKAQSTKKGS